MSRYGDPTGWRYYQEWAICIAIALGETVRENVRKLWVYPLLSLLWLIEGRWYARRWNRKNPEKGV